MGSRETQGVRQIVRLNWPFYAAAAVVVAAMQFGIARWQIGATGRLLLRAGTAAVLLWTLASLVASWIIYDYSRLSKWHWIRDVLTEPPRTWLNIHSGFDESTATVRQLLAPSSGRVFDIFDPVEMSEPSIARARRICRPVVDPELVDFHHLPVVDGSIDAVFLLLSAHELRSEPARRTLFRELHRVLAPEGRVIVAEHLRDWANFAAFGPGFLHFFSRRIWARSFLPARLVIDRELSITPFVKVFVLRRSV